LLVRDYGQYCPIARSSELLAERWTPIIVRNLLNGCRTFGEIRQGAPGIPTALLAQRLNALQRHGIVVRHRDPARRGATYELTEMGQELRAVCHAMVLRERPELCTTGAGYIEDIVCETDSGCLVDLHLKRTTYPAAIRSGRLVLSGPPVLTRQFKNWFGPSPFADVTRTGSTPSLV
jgi:DNA-binding HxlR family transcriptional regulator